MFLSKPIHLIPWHVILTAYHRYSPGSSDFSARVLPNPRNWYQRRSFSQRQIINTRISCHDMQVNIPSCSGQFKVKNDIRLSASSSFLIDDPGSPSSVVLLYTKTHTNHQLPSSHDKDREIRLPVDGVNHPNTDTGQRKLGRLGGTAVGDMQQEVKGPSTTKMLMDSQDHSAVIQTSGSI